MRKSALALAVNWLLPNNSRAWPKLVARHAKPLRRGVKAQGSHEWLYDS